ncbi:MAG: hypothetical protein BroJett040_21610 [Oligoflexia bacterium]|nr:MAG: hypothetical protein BroJett040_21610 [Oligoflexia bacterium]
MASIQTQCQVIQQSQGSKQISSLRIQNQGNGKGVMSLITQRFGGDHLEIINSEGQLKNEGKLIAFAGESKLGRTALLVKDNVGTVTIRDNQFTVVCKESLKTIK